MSRDYYRLLTDRVREGAPNNGEALEAIFANARAELEIAHADAAEHDQLERAIRRHRLQWQREAPAPGKSTAHQDEIYRTARFSHLRRAESRDGMIGWRDGADPWVSLELAGGPDASASSETLQQAFDKAARVLARRGYCPIAKPTDPFAIDPAWARRHYRQAQWTKRAGAVALGGALLIIAYLAGAATA